MTSDGPSPLEYPGVAHAHTVSWCTLPSPALPDAWWQRFSLYPCNACPCNACPCVIVSSSSQCPPLGGLCHEQLAQHTPARAVVEPLVALTLDPLLHPCPFQPLWTSSWPSFGLKCSWPSPSHSNLENPGASSTPPGKRYMITYGTYALDVGLPK